MMSANTPTPISQASRPPRCVRSASVVGEESRRRRGGALSWAASRPWPMSRRRSIRAATSSRASVARAGRIRTAGRGAGERPQLLCPAQRRRPPQPAGGRGVRDHPQQQRDGEHRAGDPRGHAPRRRDLAGDRADADEHRQRRDERDREEDRGPGPGAADEDPDQQRQPDDRRARSRSPPSAARNACARLTGAGEDELRGGRRPPRRAARARPPGRPTARRRSRRRPAATTCSRRRSADRGARRRAGAPRRFSPKLRSSCRRSCERRVRARGRPRPARPSRARNSSANEIVRVRASRSVWRASALAADTAVAVVVVQEDLLQRRLAAR